MRTHAPVQKRGKQLVVVIPAEFATERKIQVGTVLDLDSLCVRPLRRRIKLSELMTQFKPKHRHGEWHLGNPVGNEIG